MGLSDIVRVLCEHVTKSRTAPIGEGLDVASRDAACLGVAWLSVAWPGDPLLQALSVSLVVNEFSYG